MEEIIVLVVILGVMMALLYPFLGMDFDEHPIWNLVYVIPAFYGMPISLIGSGLDLSVGILVVLGVIQLIVHIIIVIAGYEELFISKLSVFLIASVAFFLRICFVLYFAAVVMMLIELIPRTDVSLFHEVLSFFS